MREINEAGLNLIKQFEGCVLTVYRDPIGLPTVGYGHRTNWPIGETISQELANSLLCSDLIKFELGVNKLVTAEITDNQFSALVAFAFNLGLGALAHSTLIDFVNRFAFSLAANAFLIYDHAGRREIEGLKRRREAEKKLFLTP
jgi:lysozyme